jgi:hypothetical protein
MRGNIESETQVWKIATGVAAGILIASAVGFAFRVWYVNRVMEEMSKAMTSVISTSQEQAQQIARRQELAVQAAKAREAERLVAVAASQRAEEERKRAAEAAKQAKEDAWARYYRKPARCENAEGQAFVECANEYIRAKRRFEELYAAGKL